MREKGKERERGGKLTEIESKDGYIYIKKEKEKEGGRKGGRERERGRKGREI
jgi:hypothetical protein